MQKILQKTLYKLVRRNNPMERHTKIRKSKWPPYISIDIQTGQ